MLGSSPLSWKKNNLWLQYQVLRLSIVLGSCEVTWLTALLKDVGLQDLPPTVLNCDNQAALALVTNHVLHERTKYVEIDCHFIRDRVKTGEIETKYVPSYVQVAWHMCLLINNSLLNIIHN